MYTQMSDKELLELHALELQVCWHIPGHFLIGLAAGAVQGFNRLPRCCPVQDQLLPPGQPWGAVVKQRREGSGALHGPAVAGSVWGWQARALLRLLRRCYGRRNTRNRLRHSRSALPCYVVTPKVKEI